MWASWAMGQRGTLGTAPPSTTEVGRMPFIWRKTNCRFGTFGILRRDLQLEGIVFVWHQGSTCCADRTFAGMVFESKM